MSRLRIRPTRQVAALVGLAAWPLQVLALPLHPHGPGWTSWERDGDVGAARVDHAHPAPGASEAGDEAHQHYVAVGFRGWGDEGEPFSAFGAWNDRSAFVDTSDPFATRAEYQTHLMPHGYVSDSKKIRYRFAGDVWTTDAKAKSAASSLEAAFGLWSDIDAEKSPVTGKPLTTGFGYELTKGAASEITLHWSDIDDASGGGVTGNLTAGTHTSANPVTITFDSSYDWDFTQSGLLADPTKWHFFSVALHEIGHTAFLYHQLDKDLLDPSVGEPIYKVGDPEGDGSYRWAFLHNEAGENDYFTGWHGTWDGTAYVYTPIEDKDSVDAIKSLYSIPTPETGTTLSMLAAALFGLGAARRRIK